MSKKLYVDLKSALGHKPWVTVAVKDIERALGEDWLLEFSAQAHQLGARADPHQTNSSQVLVTRN